MKYPSIYERSSRQTMHVEKDSNNEVRQFLSKQEIKERKIARERNPSEFRPPSDKFPLNPAGPRAPEV